MNVHLLDGTYELFRHHFALPSHVTDDGVEVAATRGVVASVLSLLEEGVTHLGVATDEVVESFRNALYPAYKTAAGVDPALLAQFPLLEEALRALGVVVGAMREHEADDGLATGAALAAGDERVEQVLICTPDKDLAQCVDGRRVVLYDRRKRMLTDERGVFQRFGVRPASIPDYLALVGDPSDGFPGLRGWGPRSAATILARWERLEHIPDRPAMWEVEVRGARRLADTLAAEREHAYLFRDLATLRRDAPFARSVDELRWTGPTDGFAEVCRRLDAPELPERARRLAEGTREPR